jgi:hypothetical protein
VMIDDGLSPFFNASPEPTGYYDDWDDPRRIGRDRRRNARHWGHQLRRWRKPARHERDRFWQARNRPAFDPEAPF